MSDADRDRRVLSDPEPLRDDDPQRRTETLQREVIAQQTRKEEARRRGDRTVWFGLGMFGLVGWSVAIPTLVGVAIGLWIDTRWPSRFSWTLMLLVAGVILGCLNAWRWVSQEREEEEL